MPRQRLLFAPFGRGFCFVFAQLAPGPGKFGLSLFKLILNFSMRFMSAREFAGMAAQFKLSHHVTRKDAESLLLVRAKFAGDFVDDA